MLFCFSSFFPLLLIVIQIMIGNSIDVKTDEIS